MEQNTSKVKLTCSIAVLDLNIDSKWKSAVIFKHLSMLSVVMVLVCIQTFVIFRNAIWFTQVMYFLSTAVVLAVSFTNIGRTVSTAGYRQET